MSLFDQQPMGPVPARKPVRYVPDPELEAAGVDPEAVEIEVMEPRPAELRAPVAGRHGHLLRNTIAWLLLAPFLLSLIGSAINLAQREESDDRLTTSYLVAAGIVLAVIVVSHLLFRRRAGRTSTGVPD
jgi:hypothetical protein